MLNVEEEIRQINNRLESIWEVLKAFPNNVGLASNLDTDGKFKRRTTKEDIRNQLIKQWNKEHPFYKINS